MQQRVCSIISRVLKVPLAAVDASSSPDTLKNWDSLQHLQIVLALEEEFGVEFSVDEIVALQRVDTIVEILRERAGPGRESAGQ
jgi:acyl carrier protein